MRGSALVPWKLPEAVGIRWDAKAVPLPKLAARQISRIGHPLTRWIDAGRSLAQLGGLGGRGSDDALFAKWLERSGAELKAQAGAGLLLLEFQWQGHRWRLLDGSTDLALVQALADGPLGDLGDEPDLSVRKSRVAEHLQRGEDFLIDGASLRGLQALACLPSWRRAFLDRMRAGHWRRVRSLLGEEWFPGPEVLPLGAEFPDLSIRAWRDLSDAPGPNWELVLRDGGRWQAWRSEMTAATDWQEAVRQASSGAVASLARRIEAGPRFLGIYARDDQGWTDFLGLVGVQREAEVVRLCPVKVGT